jgi:hypothetical protein
LPLIWLISVQTAQEPDARDSSAFNLGGQYDLTDDYHLLFSAGRGLANPATTNRLSAYLALQVIY